MRAHFASGGCTRPLLLGDSRPDARKILRDEADSSQQPHQPVLSGRVGPFRASLVIAAARSEDTLSHPNATPARRVHKRGTNVSPTGIGSSSNAGQSLAASTRRPTRRDRGQYARPPPRPTHQAEYGLLATAASDTRRKGCTLRWSCRAKGWYEAPKDATSRLPAPNSAPTATGVPNTSHSAPPDKSVAPAPSER
jgi:hypothetical protein